MRVFELADEFGWTSMRTLEACREAGVPARSSGEDLGPDDVERVRAFMLSVDTGEIPLAPPAPTITTRVPIPPPAGPAAPGSGQSVYKRGLAAPPIEPEPVPTSIDMDLLPVFEPSGPVGTAGLDPDELATARRLNTVRRPGAGRKRGRIPAAGAPRRVLLLVGALVLLALIGLFLLNRDSTPEVAPPPRQVPAEQPLPDGAERIEAAAVTVGDCLRVTADAATGATVAGLVRVPCDLPHDFESFAVTEHPDAAGTPFPSDAAVEALATERCLGIFPGYVGGPYEGSGYQVRFMRPTERSWSEQGDRRIICGLSLPDGSAMVGSAGGTVTANAPTAAPPGS